MVNLERTCPSRSLGCERTPLLCLRLKHKATKRFALDPSSTRDERNQKARSGNAAVDACIIIFEDGLGVLIRMPSSSRPTLSEHNDQNPKSFLQL